MSSKELNTVVERMKAWAEANPWADTQGLMDDEWESLAAAALGLPEPHPPEADD